MKIPLIILFLGIYSTAALSQELARLELKPVSCFMDFRYTSNHPIKIYKDSILIDSDAKTYQHNISKVFENFPIGTYKIEYQDIFKKIHIYDLELSSDTLIKICTNDFLYKTDKLESNIKELKRGVLFPYAATTL